jgi:DeoR/GlpR family transcriptional regulator of sugar metabolism
VVLVGGALNRRSGGICGPQALQFIQTLRVDLCFLGACAVDVRHGLSAWDAEEAVLKRAMVEASGETAVAVTADKLGAAAPFGIAPIGDLDHLVVEASTPPAMAAAFQEKGVRVHFASAGLQRP